jgi:Na+-driven multidrug efflux pump
MLLNRHGIAALFVGPAGGGLAAGLLAIVAAYHLGDATQALCVFVLRCYRVAVAPLVAYCVLLWGVGVAAATCSPIAAWALARAAQPGRFLDRQQPSRWRCWPSSCR